MNRETEHRAGLYVVSDGEDDEDDGDGKSAGDVLRAAEKLRGDA